MSLLLSFAPYIIAALVGVWGMGKISGVQIKNLEAERTILQAEVKLLEGEKAGWKLASERCSASIIEARKASEARDKAASAAIAKARQEAQAREKRLAELALEAANPPVGATCESAVVAVTERL